MGKKQKIARIEVAMAEARSALEGVEVPRLEGATRELRDATLDAWDHGSELGAPALLQRMRARVEELEVTALQRALTACPSCKGTELLVSQRSGSVDLGGASVTVVVVVCRACGDVRLRCEDPAALAQSVLGGSSIKEFRTITLPAPETAPFR